MLDAETDDELTLSKKEDTAKAFSDSKVIIFGIV